MPVDSITKRLPAIIAHRKYGRPSSEDLATADAFEECQAEISRLEAKVKELEARNGADRFLEDALIWRGIDNGCACKECGGSGTKAYSDTSTWRGGVGGQAITGGVCDHCWGSGDEYCKWPSHRRLEAVEQWQARAKKLESERDGIALAIDERNTPKFDVLNYAIDLVRHYQEPDGSLTAGGANRLTHMFAHSFNNVRLKWAEALGFQNPGDLESGIEQLRAERDGIIANAAKLVEAKAKQFNRLTPHLTKEHSQIADMLDELVLAICALSTSSGEKT